jgi:hypothetical protein
MTHLESCTWQPVDEFIPKGLFIGSVWNRNKQKAETKALIKRCSKYYLAETGERLDLSSNYLTHYQPLPAPVAGKPVFQPGTPSKPSIAVFPDVRFTEYL